MERRLLLRMIISIAMVPAFLGLTFFLNRWVSSDQVTALQVTGLVFAGLIFWATGRKRAMRKKALAGAVLYGETFEEENPPAEEPAPMTQAIPPLGGEDLPELFVKPSVPSSPESAKRALVKVKFIRTQTVEADIPIENEHILEETRKIIEIDNSTRTIVKPEIEKPEKEVA